MRATFTSFCGSVIVAGFVVVASAHGQVMRSATQMKDLDLQALLETQVISTSRTLDDWQTAPAALSVLTAPEIERSGAVRLAEVLRLVPGLNVSRYLGSSYAITARGFSNASVNKMQVLMDGRSLYTPLFSGVFWEVQDTVLVDLDRIEVVRGPGASLWGANAMNGVINIVSKHARDTQGAFVTAGAGTEEKKFTAVRYGAKRGENSWFRVYGKYAARDDQIMSNGMAAGDDMMQKQTGFRIDHGDPTGSRATLQGDAYWIDTGNLGRSDSRHRGWNLLGRWTRPCADETTFTLQSYFDYSARDVPRQFSETRNTWDVDAQWQLRPTARHEVVAGVGYRNSWDRTGTEGDRTFVFSPSRKRIELVTGFVQDEIALEPDRWALYLGSKFEYNDYTGFEVQPGVRLAYTPDNRQTWWGAVSRAVRTPTRIDTHSRFRPMPESGFVLIQGDPAFTSEEALSGELGYRIQPRDNLVVDFATYYTTYDALRTLEPSLPSGLPLIIGNGRKGTTYGAELVLTVQPTRWWRLRGNLNYFHADLRLKPGSLDSTGGSFEANDPEVTAFVQSTMNLGKRVQWDFLVRGATQRPNPALSGYVTVDMRVAWQPRPEWELALIGQNLLSPSHPELPGGGASQPEVERSIFARASFRY